MTEFHGMIVLRHSEHITTLHLSNAGISCCITQAQTLLLRSSSISSLLSGPYPWFYYTMSTSNLTCLKFIFFSSSFSSDILYCIS